MLDINFIQDNPDIVEAAIKNKKVKVELSVSEILDLYQQLKDLRGKEQDLNEQRNKAAKDRDAETGKRIKDELASLNEDLKPLEEKYLELMKALPNVPSADTPVGKDEDENQVLRTVGDKPSFDFQPKTHWELGEELGIIDKKTAAEVSGARFAYLLGDLAVMQFALVQFVFASLTNADTLQKIADQANLDIAIKPFTAVVPPVFIRPEIFDKMGRLEPREDRYYIPSDDLYLVGSAEHTMGPMLMDTTIDSAELPLRYIGYSTAFRREAGTYGKDTEGILRVHQFDKLEMETFVTADSSYQEQDFLVAIQEYILQSLKLPYEVMMICTGDMGLPDHRQIDINTWMPGQDKYRETHTSDLMTTFQSRRLNIKVKNEDDSKDFVHMNDATAIAIGRVLIAIMENYQQADGSIQIPEVLIPYMNGKTVISKS
jgi:seryl-tRNA synthetase